MTPRRRARGPSHGRSCGGTPAVLADRGQPPDGAGHESHRPALGLQRSAVRGGPSRVRPPSSADAVAVVMTRRHLQAPALLNHQPAQAGPRHAAEACLLAPAGAALAHRHDLCAGAQPTLSEGRVLSKETSRRCLLSPTTSPPRGLAKDKLPVKQELVPSTPVHRRGARWCWSGRARRPAEVPRRPCVVWRCM